MFFGWWMVGLGAFVTSINKTAVNKGFPVFILPVEQFFGATRAEVSLIFSLARAENGPTGPLAGWLVDKYGPRALVFVGARYERWWISHIRIFSQYLGICYCLFRDNHRG